MKLLGCFVCLCTLAVVVWTKLVIDTDGSTLFIPPPRPSGDVYFEETFTSENAFLKRWIVSSATRSGGGVYDGEWELLSPEWDGAIEGENGLVMKDEAKHYAISTHLDRPFVFKGKDGFVVQYEVTFPYGLTCGGGYVKLLLDTVNLTNFNDQSPYSIMFGPDKCGVSSKVHMIIRFKNPVTGEVEEKHSKQSTESMDFFDDKRTHLFTLSIKSDGMYHIIVDQRPFLKGNLLEDLTPPIIPSEEIDDPDDVMPEDWDEREKIPDPDAVKPDDWDEDAPQKIPDPDAEKPEGWLDDGPEYIPDPEAEIPEEWDEEEDGEWEAPSIANPACEDVGCGEWKPPMIMNPKYKGKWRPPLIDNPNYMGIWKPRRIRNKAYFEDDHPFDSLLTIGAIGFELWTMANDVTFDNIIICSELVVANNYARDGWALKFESERNVGGAMSMGPWLDWFIDTANDYPYLWALYAFGIVSPFAICAAFCVKSKPKEDEAAKRKKTDAPSPDDPQPEEKKEVSPQPEESFIAEAEDNEPVEGSGGGEQEEGDGGEGGTSQDEEEASQELPSTEEKETVEEASQEDGSQEDEPEKVVPKKGRGAKSRKKHTQVRRED